MKDFIITVGCEYGSGGPDIAKMIAKSLNLPCYDRAIIDRIIEETGLSKEMTEKVEAGVEIRGRNLALNNTASPSKYSTLTDRVVYLQTQIIHKLAERGSCVIVGRCSDYVLRKRKDVLNVFIYAPEDKRLEHIMDTLKISSEAAKVLIDKNDKQLHARYKQMTGTYRGDRHNRHILIDSSVLGFDVYASWLVVAVLVAILMTYVNIKGIKTAAVLQTVLTVIIGAVGILLIVASLFTGSAENLQSQAFASDVSSIRGILKVALLTPFFFIGFDVIPQAAEEINVDLKKIGRILILSIVLAVVFYGLIILAVGYVMSKTEIAASMTGSGLVTADAMAKAFNSSIMAKVLIVGGMCGIVTSWNSFLMGGSRAMYSMAESYMIPKCFSKLHPKYKTPINALYLVGLLTVLAPFAGRKMLVWIVDAGNFGCCVAYCMVAFSFIILRKKEPDLPRPYKVGPYKFVGVMAVLMSGFMVACYIIPNSGATLVWQEWLMVGGWIVLGGIFFAVCRSKYKEKFGSLVEIISDADAAALQIPDKELDEMLDYAISAAIEAAIATVLNEEAAKQL